MKKLIFACLAIFLIAVVLFPTVALAEEVGDYARNTDVYAFVEELCKRQSDDELSVTEFIKQKFVDLLGEDAVEEQEFTVDKKSYVNLIATVSSANATEQIIIGAHYDSMYEGAGDNACGVASLYLIMQRLSMEKLPFDVVFVAFDGEEDGLLGSYHYVREMSQRVRQSTIVMFNIDTIATGDNLYFMCENKSTDLAKLILNNASGLQEKPYAKGTFGSAFDYFGYGYYEMVQGSDHTPFRLAGIPIAFFFSGTYSANFWDYAESTDPSKAVMNTKKDTFDNLVLQFPNFEQRIVLVADAVVNTVTSDEFLTIDTRAQLVNLNFWYNSWWPILALAVIIIVMLILAIVYYRKLQKNALMGKAEINSQKVFEKPKAEDIFTFKSDDSDDIFTYKK